MEDLVNQLSSERGGEGSNRSSREKGRKAIQGEAEGFSSDPHLPKSFPPSFHLNLKEPLSICRIHLFYARENICA